MGEEPWTLSLSVLALLASGLVLIVAGTRFTRLVDRLADRLGIGEALAGAVLLGATTSLPGLIVTTLAASRGEADLAVSNALGGIAAQTAFLAVADVTYRHANLEHAAASLPNLLQTMVLVSLVALVLLATAGPPVAVAGVHPVTVLLPLVYLYGLLLTKRTRDVPMWRPHETPETRPDLPDAESERAPLAPMLLAFLGLGTTVAVCGFVVARAGLAVAARTELSGTLIGGLVTSVVTSLPELVTVLAAVRSGALTLAVGDIIGGNTFDVLFLAAADCAYRGGSLYAAVGDRTVFLLALTLLLTGIFAAGLVYRQKSGIGFEGTTILGVYTAGFLVLAWMR
ncbi:MAG: sodium:calcium antiporter [Myxococcota bacterium]